MNFDKSNIYFLNREERELNERKLKKHLPMYELGFLDDIQLMNILEAEEKQELILQYKIEHEKSKK